MNPPTPPTWLALAADERFVRSAAANRKLRLLAAAGWLALTSQRLVHHPHAIERLTSGTSPWEIALEEIAVADVASPGGPAEWFSGGVRHRLRVRTLDGDQTLLVVNRVTDWVQAIAAARAQ